MTKTTNLVLIEGNKYSFFKNKDLIVKIESGNMTPDYLEYYRKNPEKIMEDAEGESND